jgi:glycerol kinase
LSTLALDLGSTRIKAARVDDEGRIVHFAERDAPPISRVGEFGREFDAQQLHVSALLALTALEPQAGEALGIASQRSSFLLWKAADGEPVTPAISWQDRRGANWIEQHSGELAAVVELTGLALSAHYVGPKLGALFSADAELARKAHAGDLRFGTLESWLIWKWADGLHVTDESMAARTLLFDPRAGTWSRELCERFGVPLALLPRVLPSTGRDDAFPFGERLRASVADQSAGALHAVGAGTDGVLVNFGTGTFALAPVGRVWTRQPGYLTALLSSRGRDSDARERIYALEGTINAGAGAIASRPAASGTVWNELPAEAHALVDANGIGAPHWRPDLGPLWSPGASALGPRERECVAELGLCFRVREILEDLKTHGRRCVVAGGALHDEAFARRLADALGRAIEVCLEPEATLLGAAGLARGDDFARGRAPTRTVAPGRFRDHLDERFAAWKRWVASVLGR